MKTILLFMCLAMQAMAQKPLLLHFTERDGLPGNTVYDVFQDSRGFVWIGTDQGVCMFDGHRFQTYTTKDGLPDNEVFTIREDDYRRCWLMCYNGQPCYIRNDKVYNAANNSLCREIAEAGIIYKSFFRDRHGRNCLAGRRICVLSQDSMSLLYPAYKFFVTAIDYFAAADNEYLLNGQNLYRLSHNKMNEIYSFKPSVFLLASYYCDGHLMLSTKENGTNYICDYLVKENSCVLSAKIPIGPLCYDFYRTSVAEILLLTETGLMAYHVNDHSLGSSGLIADKIPINRMIIDDERNCWFATVNDGVYFRPNYPVRILDASAGLRHNNAVFVTDFVPGRIIAAFNDGTFNIADSNGISEFSLPVHGAQGRIIYVYPAGNSRLIVGSDAGLYMVDPVARSYKKILTGAQKAGMLCNDHFIIGSFSSASRLDLRTNTIVEIWKKRTTAVTEDEYGRLWLGTLDGLYYYDHDSIRHFAPDATLARAHITSLAMCMDKVVIATHKDGLYLWNGRQLQHIDEQNGLSSNTCKKVVCDSSNHIWLCTGAGIDKIMLKSDQVSAVYNYTLEDGVIGRINDIAVSGSKLLAASSEGILILDKNRLSAVAAPRIYITSVSTRDTVIAYPERLVLDYSNHALQISFTGISFTGGKDLEYRYVLEGASPDTIYTKYTTINLGSVKPGNFHFLVWARTCKGPWSVTPAALSFHIDPPFWLSAWFMTLAACLCVSCGWLLYRRKIRLLRLAQEEKLDRQRQIAALEMQALRSQINPHFMFNALNSIQNFFSRNDERKANYYMTSFARLIRRSLNHSGSHWIQLSEEIDMLKSYIELEQMRFENRFFFEIVIGPGIMPDALQIPVMLVQPYVENAINHGLREQQGCEGKLLLQFEIVDECLVCTVDDNGTGIDNTGNTRPAGHKSMGMQISSQRIATLNQLYQANIRIAVADKRSLMPPGSGTLIKIYIPVINYEKDNYRHDRR